MNGTTISIFLVTSQPVYSIIFFFKLKLISSIVINKTSNSTSILKLAHICNTEINFSKKKSLCWFFSLTYDCFCLLFKCFPKRRLCKLSLFYNLSLIGSWEGKIYLSVRYSYSLILADYNPDLFLLLHS